MPLSRAAIAVSGAMRACLTPMLAQDAAIGSLGALLSDVRAANFNAKKGEIAARVKKHMAGKLAIDAKPDDIDAALDALDPKEMGEDDDDEDEDEAKKKAKAGAKDELPDDKDKKDDKPAMDAATVDAKIAAAVASANAASAALYSARALVRPICGEVALDSAETVHAFALKHLGVEVAGVHPSAFPAMIAMAQARKPPTPMIAQDSASIKSTVDLIPGLKRFA